MPLSSKVVSQFVKATKTQKPPTKETFVYGEILPKEEGSDKYYVKLDGSNTKTPITRFTSEIDGNQRVIVMIKNHEAIVTGNVTSAATSVVYVDKKTEEVQEKVDEKILELDERILQFSDDIQAMPKEFIESLWSDYFNSTK